MFLYFRIITLLFGILNVINCEDSSPGNSHTESRIYIDESILCRYCGAEVSDSHFLFPNLSPQAQYSFNETIFGKEKVLVQVLSNSLSIDYPIITSKESDCEGFGEWQLDHPWYPDLLWKPCICPTCGTTLGLIFQSKTTADYNSRFYGLILSNLIGETFANSLLKLPGGSSNNGSY